MEQHWIQVIAVVGGNLAIILPLWLWSRTEARADAREMMALISSSKEEMKDFHGKLCQLEEKYIQMMQRYWENK